MIEQIEKSHEIWWNEFRSRHHLGPIEKECLTAEVWEGRIYAGQFARCQIPLAECGHMYILPVGSPTLTLLQLRSPKGEHHV